MLAEWLKHLLTNAVVWGCKSKQRFLWNGCMGGPWLIKSCAYSAGRLEWVDVRHLPLTYKELGLGLHSICYTILKVARKQLQGRNYNNGQSMSCWMRPDRLCLKRVSKWSTIAMGTVAELAFSPASPDMNWVCRSGTVISHLSRGVCRSGTVTSRLLRDMLGLELSRLGWSYFLHEF